MSGILKMPFFCLVLFCTCILTSRGQEGKQEREIYSHDFYLNQTPVQETHAGAESSNDAWEPFENDNVEDNMTEKTPSREWHEDENQIVMLDDFFVVPPEGKQREDILFIYFLPALLGICLLTILWGYFKSWFDDKKERHQTQQKLLRLRREFRGNPNAPEFHSRLKKILKLPPGATKLDINRTMPFRDNELQQMIDQHDNKFRDSSS